MASISFDRASGVVFTENTSARVRSMIPTWMSQARGKRGRSSMLRSRGKGCSSLQDMALRSCVWNVELFLPETLQWATWHYAGRIYQRLKDCDALTFNAWVVFLEAYPDEISTQQAFHVQQQDQWSYEPIQLPSIIDRLAKLNTKVLTFLCVQNFDLTFDHLKLVIKIPTLAALILEQRPGGTWRNNTRHLLDWSRLVRESNALRNLRLIILCDFGAASKAVLEAVSSFPALSLVGLQNSRTGNLNDRPAQTYGDWDLTTVEGLEHRGSSPDTFDPQSIWSSSHRTSAQKTQMLYDLASHLVQPPCDQHESLRSVCVIYTGYVSQSIHDTTSWFVRKSQVETQVPLNSQRMAFLEYESRTASKRRKIRSAKKTDLTSMLGAFK